MYEVFYNLRAEPFRLSPDHKFCYEHNSYAKARAYMAYAFKRAEGFVMITGRPGTGKTTLIGELVESLARDKVATANLVCTQLQADDLLKSVAFSFGIGSQRADKAELLQRLNVLFQRWHREGRRALLIVDEAQDLSQSAMEELRLLTNIQLSGQPLLQIFLLGQPELRDLILSPEMEQVHQRIVAATHIEGLEADETEAYVLRRLEVVGWAGDPALDRAIFPLIHKYSEGVPRRINLICSRLFLLGSVEQRHAIGLDDVRVVIGELQAENLAAGTSVSSEDFVAQGQTQWVEVPGIQGEPQQDRPEVYLQAVNNDSLPPQAEDAPIEPFQESKKKELTPHSAEPPTTEDSDSYNQASVDLYPDPEPGSAARTAYTADIIPDEPPPRAARPPLGRVAGRGKPARKRSGWGRGIAILALVLMVMALAFLLESYLTRDNVKALTAVQVPQAEVVSHQPRAAEVAVTSSADAVPATSRELLEPSATQFESNPVYERVEGRSTALETERAIVSNATAQSASASDEEGLSAPQFVAVAPLAEDELLSGEALVIEDEISLEAVHIVDAPEQKTLFVRFSFDSDDLPASSQPVLEQAVAWLQDNPETAASIRGFADNQGDEIYNLTLSKMRAEAVERYLVDAGIERQRLQVEGLGAYSGAEEAVPEIGTDAKQYRVVQITLAQKFD